MTDEPRERQVVFMFRCAPMSVDTARSVTLALHRVLEDAEIDVQRGTVANFGVPLTDEELGFLDSFLGATTVEEVTKAGEASMGMPRDQYTVKEGVYLLPESDPELN